MAKNLIGSGMTASVYFEEGFAYKVYKPSHDIHAIEYEKRLTNLIKEQTSLNMPFFYDTNNDHELKMTYFSGETLAVHSIKRHYKNGIEDLIRLGDEIHSYHVKGLENAHDRFFETLSKSSLDENIKDKALDYLASIKHMDNLLHLDLHFENILFDGSSHFIIDWVNAKQGNPVLDLARSYVILREHAYRLSINYLKKLKSMRLESLDEAIFIMAALRFIEIGYNTKSLRIIELLK